MEQINNDAVSALKVAKSQGLTYYEASQALLKQGYTQSQIEQASYQFPYTDIDAPDKNAQVQLSAAASQAFGEAIAKEKTLDHLREERDNAFLKSALFGRYVPLYDLSAIRAWADYTAAKKGQSKFRVYSSWLVAMTACAFIFPLAGLIVVKLRLHPVFLVVLFFVGIIGVNYALNRYLRTKD
ncbi:MAG TPA: hypothetical protein VFL85_00545 [Candidatus Saccharimonadales bacterium]|nr:hypothetical protein [Candidatus Saccharimonadales bacterium]